MSKYIETDAPNKTALYDSFKDRPNDPQLRAKGKLTLKIEESTYETDKESSNYNFYYIVHKYPLLSI
ncbi:hypothetical protein [Flavobacterium sp. WC2430]|uniref:hypothetical protein n=1 Tax=Flavobacterium sp. WC2430 TaxID=3234137 RepID=UPI0034679CA6